jgi:hypothetical protein
MGITLFWSVYFMLFGPVIVVDLAAIVGFIVCFSRGGRFRSHIF